MITYYLKYEKNTENIDSKMLKTENGRPFLSWKCTVYGSKRSRYMKEQEAIGLLSSLGLTTPLNIIALLGDILL